MDAASDMKDRHARMLGRLAELGMELAENLQAAALTAEDPEDKARLADGFHKLSRSVRQSMALEARLHRESHRIEREAAAEPRARRSAQIRASLDRLVWTEAEDIHTAKYWSEGVSRFLAEAEFEPDFETHPVADIVEALGRTILARRPPSPYPPEPEVTGVNWVIVDPDGTRTPYTDTG